MSFGKKIGYVRVSTDEQNPDRQLEGVALDKKFVEFASGTSLARPELSKMLDYIRDDDIVLVHSMDRMARNLRDLQNVIDHCLSKGARVHFVKENLIFENNNSPIANLLLNVIGAVAQFEYEFMRERQLEGIRLAKLKGKYKGRKKKELKPDVLAQIQNDLADTRKTKTQIAEEAKISRVFLNNLIKEKKWEHLIKK